MSALIVLAIIAMVVFVAVITMIITLSELIEYQKVNEYYENQNPKRSTHGRPEGSKPK